MATVYRFEVECVSAFCAYPDETVSNIIKKSLEEYEDEVSGMKLESITVKKVDAFFIPGKTKRLINNR